MYKFWGSKRLFILLFGLIFFIALMGLTLTKREQITWPEKFLKDTISFTQGLIYKPAAYIAGFFEDVGNLRTIYEENKVLKLTLSQYAMDIARLNELEVQNERLKTALDFTEQQKKANDYVRHYADVTADSPDPYNHTITVNLGKKDGMKVNMAVVSTDGLIGLIKRVSAFTSNVELITNMNNNLNTTKAIAATVVGKEEQSFGIVESYDETAEGGSLVFVMTKISKEDPLVAGDVVITSGLGSVFPAGIVIGTVISKQMGEFGITYTAYIKPAVKFQHLREVFVIEMPEVK